MSVMKAIPTKHAGCTFRSRLEARWAAFLDLAGFDWDYEPVDFEGWTPDFLIKLEGYDIFCEVKPVCLDRDGYSREFEKAINHSEQVWVLKLGLGPKKYWHLGFGNLCSPPGIQYLRWARDGNGYTWVDVAKQLTSPYQRDHWREAGSIVQWRGTRA